MAKQRTPGKHTQNGELPAGSGRSDREAAYFLSLSLENVRCFGPKQTLDLSDGNGKPARWTIILGVNGTGKTTILQSLAGFELLPASSLYVDENRFPRFDSMVWSPRFNYERTREQRAIWSVKYSISRKLKDNPSRTHEEKHFLENGCALHEGNIRESPVCVGYGASRRLGSVSLSDLADEDTTATLFSDKAELRNAEEWLLQLDYAASKTSALQQKQKAQLIRITEVLRHVLLEVEGIRFTSTTGTHPKPRVEFETPYGWVPLRQLGYGYQTLITWVTDLTSRMVERYPDSLDPLAEPAVVLVDEIDLHLHPIWQRKLMNFLTERFPNTQFIATTHSPLVAQAAADANLAVLRREGDHVVIDNDVDYIRNWRIDQILTSDLFGLPTARPPQIEGLIAERNKLLEKPKLTKADEKRLKQIETEIGELPFGESAQERKERDEIRKTLDLLMKDRKTAQ